MHEKVEEKRRSKAVDNDGFVPVAKKQWRKKGEQNQRDTHNTSEQHAKDSTSGTKECSVGDPTIMHVPCTNEFAILEETAVSVETEKVENKAEGELGDQQVKQSTYRGADVSVQHLDEDHATVVQTPQTTQKLDAMHVQIAPTPLMESTVIRPRRQVITPKRFGGNDFEMGGGRKDNGDRGTKDRGTKGVAIKG